MAPTVQTALTDGTMTLTHAGIASPRLDASLLLAYVLGLPRSQLILSPDKKLNDKEIIDFNIVIARRAYYEPIAYITGEKEFWSLDFYVTRDTLIPRADSETLIEAALQRMRSKKSQEQTRPTALLDIGTGTGCLLIALLKELPTASGVGLDNSEHALQVAKENAKRHGVDTRAVFIKSHWCDALNGTFDLILSNPPYIAEGAMRALMPDVLHFEPHTALAAGADGLDAYRALAPQVAMKLNPGGYMLFEVGQGQAEAVSALLTEQGLVAEETKKDMAGVARCVVTRKAS